MLRCRVSTSLAHIYSKRSSLSSKKCRQCVGPKTTTARWFCIMLRGRSDGIAVGPAWDPWVTLGTVWARLGVLQGPFWLRLGHQSDFGVCLCLDKFRPRPARTARKAVFCTSSGKQVIVNPKRPLPANRCEDHHNVTSWGSGCSSSWLVRVGKFQRCEAGVHPGY